MKRIESLLSREIGLNARSIGRSAIEAAVKRRLCACGTPEISAYLALLQRDALERSALVEEIVVSETWFFRDEEVFRTLRRHARSLSSAEGPEQALTVAAAMSTRRKVDGMRRALQYHCGSWPRKGATRTPSAIRGVLGFLAVRGQATLEL